MSIIQRNNLDHDQAVSTRNNKLWEELLTFTILEAATTFIYTIKNKHTRTSYTNSFNKIFRKRLLDAQQDLQFLSLANVDNIGDNIRESIEGSEATKQLAIATFVSFTSYLERLTQGMIRKMRPCKAGGRETFKTIRTKAKTEALNLKDCRRFLGSICKLNPKLGLIAKMLLQGGKRASEVLGSKIENIDWEAGTILFEQKKSDSLDSCTVITFPQSYLVELKSYIGNREGGLIFITRNGKMIGNDYLNRSFLYASSLVGLRVTPHVLRTSAITILMDKGCSSEEIMKVSGHASPSQVIYYDKSSRSKNVTKEINLI